MLISFKRCIFSIMVSTALVACGEAPDEPVSGSQPVSAPLLGSADSTDGADRNCRVVLRSAAQVPGQTGYETDCSSGKCWFVWTVSADVANEFAHTGAQPALMYRNPSVDSWYSVAGEPVAGASAGYQRFAFRLAEHTIAAGLTASAMERSKLELVPFVGSTGGTRLFDHNRYPSDFDNYWLANANGFKIDDDGQVCAQRPAGESALVFRAGWTHAQHGAIVAGNRLRVDYDLYRLPECMSSTYNGMPAWETTAFVRFEPSGLTVNGGLRELNTADGSIDARPFVTQVPEGTTGVALWFQTIGRTCSAQWDSNMGENYRFDVVARAPASPEWAGDWGNGLTRACEHIDGLDEPVVLTSYNRERSCMFIDADVWVTNLTDANALQPHVIQAQVVSSIDGAAQAPVYLRFIGRVGNNYRYRWTLEREQLLRTSWQQIDYRFRFSTDGINWLLAGQPDGSARTIVRDASF
ncbi:MAG: hypothetical protein H0U74_22290 [Bradymonadaceae bacterium]|nr:hypothetical protein [Lujinxingiaceae bacterium]